MRSAVPRPRKPSQATRRPFDVEREQPRPQLAPHPDGPSRRLAPTGWGTGTQRPGWHRGGAEGLSETWKKRWEEPTAFKAELGWASWLLGTVRELCPQQSGQEFGGRGISTGLGCVWPRRDTDTCVLRMWTVQA